MRRFVALQLGVTALFAALVLVVFGGGDEPAARWWVALALFALVLVAGAWVARSWSRPAPLAADDPDPRDTALRRLSSHIARAFLVLEIPLVISAVLGLAGLIGGGVMLVTVVAALAALVFGTWPTRRNVDRFAAALEQGGASSGLREAFSR
ncbi:hypothetical protein IDH50_12220 [Aeromicrobium tamlense]|uniref:Uncharacterized protein n=1 Tax=Aeromicrobium tamlense TaxID=375541 RepID=A0A8I0FXP2_9ACTN|nr:hypothetical protein [Aeromicrobium tamlense]MBD1271001.1 hypothetical protein [Aeromicrobium tamlense]NYI38393.1 hypothetical protein [Aeromicrobium tamlense]